MDRFRVVVSSYRKIMFRKKGGNMKNYNVGWIEIHSVTVTAKNKEEAAEIVINREFINEEAAEFEEFLWVNEDNF